jgi:hypothetical protein
VQSEGGADLSRLSACLFVIFINALTDGRPIAEASVATLAASQGFLEKY